MACSKEFLLALVVSTILIINTWSVPLDSENNEEDLYLSGLEVVDDMIFDRISFASSQQAKTWPLGIVYYKISSVFGKRYSP